VTGVARFVWRFPTVPPPLCSERSVPLVFALVFAPGGPNFEVVRGGRSNVGDTDIGCMLCTSVSLCSGSHTRRGFAFSSLEPFG